STSLRQPPHRSRLRSSRPSAAPPATLPLTPKERPPRRAAATVGHPGRGRRLPRLPPARRKSRPVLRTVPRIVPGTVVRRGLRRRDRPLRGAPHRRHRRLRHQRHRRPRPRLRRPRRRRCLAAAATWPPTWTPTTPLPTPSRSTPFSRPWPRSKP
ncbi:unnamed protein product, partial [Scytosiphon promiscuus]